MILSNQDKSAWCGLGEEAESRFAGRAFRSGCAVYMNPMKAVDKFTHDLMMVMPADLKTIRTRFNTADRYGIDPKTAFTLNKKDVVRYVEKYPNIILVFDIDYGDFKSIRYAPLREIRRAIKSGVAKLHVYQQRMDDQSGNAKESWVMDAMWFQELETA
jgi:hypothetical protein